MSVGFFLGIHASYIDEAQDAAESYLDAINSALNTIGLDNYADPDIPPIVYNDGLFGRSALDHHSARCLIEFAERATADGKSPHLGLLAVNPYRVAFVPECFDSPLPTGCAESIGGDMVQIWVGSAPQLLAELAAAAQFLEIPLEQGDLEDVVARKINDFAGLYEGDDCSLAEDERTAWLVLYEGARLAVRHGVALSLAG